MGFKFYSVSFNEKVGHRRRYPLLDVEIALNPRSGIFTHRGMMNERRQKRRPSRVIGSDRISYFCPHFVGMRGDRL